MCRYRPFLILFAFFLLLSGCNSPSVQSESEQNGLGIASSITEYYYDEFVVEE
ncbi:MAG: hypothetical protein J6R45_04440 [Clostridia bacterium]|nr:hypothetical protein [Clostridia bacterium]